MRTVHTKNLFMALAVATATLGIATYASAAPILIDWSTATSISNPAGGNYWNSLGSGVIDLPTTALIDTANAATGISVEVDNTSMDISGTNGAGFGGNGINGPAGAAPFDQSAAVIDGIFANNNTVGTSRILFTGLANSTQYDISAIGGRASTGVDGIIDVLQGAASGPFTLLNVGTILNFSVTSTVGGVIELDFSKATDVSNPGTSATFNAMSITAVPEPTTFALLGSGVAILGFSLARRRRSPSL
jgi:hypothetical protein